MTTKHDGHRIIKKGKTSAGVQRYYCKDCAAYLPTGTQHGGDRRMIGDRPLTPAERKRRSRAKKSRPHTPD